MKCLSSCSWNRMKNLSRRQPSAKYFATNYSHQRMDICHLSYPKPNVPVLFWKIAFGHLLNLLRPTTNLFGPTKTTKFYLTAHKNTKNTFTLTPTYLLIFLLFKKNSRQRASPFHGRKQKVLRQLRSEILSDFLKFRGKDPLLLGLQLGRPCYSPSKTCGVLGLHIGNNCLIFFVCLSI